MIPFIIAEQEGDVMIIKRRCAKEIEIGCVFDDHEGTPGVSYHFWIENKCCISRLFRTMITIAFATLPIAIKTENASKLAKMERQL